MKIWNYKPNIRMKDVQEFFKDNNLITDAKNSVEMAKRLGWLTEGMLKSNLTLNGRTVIDQTEIDQWNNFITWLENKT